MSGPVVLVPLDGSKQALGALPIARRLADLLSVPVRILHVAEQPGPLAETADRLGLEPTHLRGATLELRAGSPPQAIVGAAADWQARLIVMSGHAGPVRPADGIGAVALAVLRDAPCPVVLVDPTRAKGEWTLKRVLVPHDGSPAVSDALRPAAELARRAGAELVVLQAAGAEYAAESGSIATPMYVDQPQHEWPAWSGEFLQRLATVCPLADVRVRLLVGRGEPAEETIRVANEESADLVVLAWRGHLDAHGAPTLRAVLRDAPCPIMVTRIPDP
jgi:nucleotide-binding universal stress UspA family protein